ncbi:hypothetical protein BDR04DRAFT_1115437 [Suillus decipiens]|nr:hypothetical protein BDR04DRAFT_1115437 [Suillus decipiens]
MAELGRTWQLAEGLGQKLAEVKKLSMQILSVSTHAHIKNHDNNLPKHLTDATQCPNCPPGEHEAAHNFLMSKIKGQALIVTPALGETAPMKRWKKGSFCMPIYLSLQEMTNTCKGSWMKYSHHIHPHPAMHSSIISSTARQYKLKRSLYGSVATEVKQYPVVLVLEDMTGNHGNARNLLATSKKAMDQTEIGNGKQFIALRMDNPSVMQAYC